jgi:hypothetical protein
MWAPRVFALGVAAFLALFALDVFEEGLGFPQVLVPLRMHLIPTFVLLAVTALA